MSFTLVVANGELNSGVWLDCLLTSADQTVAVDGGANHLWDLQVLPDLYIGDSDSVTAETEQWLSNSKVEKLLFDVDKDKTDLEITLDHIINSSEKVLIAGALGGRSDHMLAIMLLLTKPEFIDESIFLVSKNELIWVSSSGLVIEGKVGATVSILPITDQVTFNACKGLKWDLSDLQIERGSTRGVSNILKVSEAEIQIKSGTAICIQHIAVSNSYL